MNHIRSWFLSQLSDVFSTPYVRCLEKALAEARAENAQRARQALEHEASKSSDRAHIASLLQQLEEQSKQLEVAELRGMRDPLTGILNRLGGVEIVSQIIRSWLRHSESVSVSCVVIDLDGFKHINDVYGHPAGDKVLVQVADRLKAIFQRAEDVVYRFGGDEFVVFVIGPSYEEATARAEYAVREIGMAGIGVSASGGGG